jgi:hypothetical protein
MDTTITVTLPSGETLTAPAPMGLPGTLATMGWEAARVRAEVGEYDMTGQAILARRADLTRALAG